MRVRKLKREMSENVIIYYDCHKIGGTRTKAELTSEPYLKNETWIVLKIVNFIHTIDHYNSFFYN